MRMRVGAVALTVVAACGGAQQDEVVERDYDGQAEVEVEEMPAIPGRRGRTVDHVPDAPPVDTRDPGTYPRDQPNVRALRRWNGTFVVDTSAGRFTLDLEAGEAHPLALAGVEEVLEIATQGTTAVALVKKDGARALVAAAGDRWVDKALPEAVRASAASLVLAADTGSLVVWAGDRIHRLRGATWTNVAVGPLPRQMRGGPGHVLLNGDRLYLGWDSGEWGGGVLVLDAATGQWSVGPDNGTPVHDIERGPDGKVWVANGLAHLGGRRGALHQHDGTTWTRVAASSNAQHEPNHDWNLPPDSFQSVAFAGDGVLHVLTGTLGIVRRDSSGIFRQRTRSWPPSRFLYVQELELEGDRAVIASLDAGVWIWDLSSGDVRRIPLRSVVDPAP